ncbi:helix-turn-helix domain-containing protein [Streptomonospora wellingtoniae]|uniref:Helix-turn-helix domain-containing protein n=1 Tax=Streptomonospora wellingtoniae TaxID=3075544 RepID=A0ABU2KN32_9ACTN|nr:helix-turn-helix domain-containing protein [Streptomonospora sp. DSM 45055]MDT0300669.1 helix-turn-helix domain-containing protein [Streptomonospora sp. DSM 45055]
MSTPRILDDLLRHLRLSASQDLEAESRRLADRFRGHTGADIALVDGDGAVDLATAGITANVLAALRPVLEQLAGGRLAAAATQTDELHVRCEVLRRESPRTVLVVASRSPLTREAITLASHTGTVIDALRRVRNADDLAHRYNRAAGRLRLAVFMALMAGDLALARRMTTGAVPPLLDADRVRLHVLHCPPPDRDRIAERYQDSSGYHGRSLMLRCPVYDSHLICLVPDDGCADVDDGLSALLRSLVGDEPRYALGISEPRPLAATAEAYEQARHALAAARHTPDRAAPYHGHAPLARLLPRDQAHAWARAVLAPLQPLPRLTVDVTRLALSFPRSGVARLLGISRNTVTAHLRRVEQALGLDLHDVHCRADLTLALTVTGLPSPESAPTGTGAAPSLDALLATEEAATWARSFLKPLRDGGHQQLFPTLRTWVDSDTDAQRTARTLDMSRTTVRAHLRTAERLLNRDLLASGPGTHDLVHALRVTDSAS